MYSYIISSLFSIPLIVKGSTSDDASNDPETDIGFESGVDFDSFDLFGGLTDENGDNLVVGMVPEDVQDAIFNKDSLEWLLQSTMIDDNSFTNLARSGPLSPEAMAGFNVFDRPVVRSASIPVEEPPADVPAVDAPVVEPRNPEAIAASSSRPPRPKPSLRVDTTLAYRNPAPSSTGSSFTDVSSSSSSSGETSRKRKSPRTDGILKIMTDNPQLDLEGILSLLGDEADLHRSTVTKLMNLRLMPIMFMDVIVRMMQRNPNTKAGDIGKEIKRTVGIAPAYWISLWTDICFTQGNRNECHDLERRMINLDINSQIECYYMDAPRWSEILRQKGYGLESRGGVELEIYLTALATRTASTSGSDSEGRSGKMRRLTEDRPRVTRVVTPELPDADIQEILAVQMQKNLDISADAVTEIITRAGGNTDSQKVQSIKDQIEKKFIVPIWLHKHILNNKDFSAEEIHDSLIRYLTNVLGGVLLVRDDISVERVREWKRFCIDGEAALIGNRCHETIVKGQMVAELSQEQKLRLLATL